MDTQVQLSEILNKEIMAVNLPGTTKDEAITQLANLLYEEEYISSIESFIKDIYYRESLGKTGIGNYIAIPHGQSESVVKNGIAIGKFTNEIPWESLDDKPVKIICLFCVKAGDGGENEHLRMLAALAGKLGNDTVVENLLKADSIDDMKDAFL
ncbi:PTS sugar transporter subunit IIA [Candidatus Enterococcus murrayae]|uniref:PTS sugar transporter subunit IIA n=1 Tax=Candidatus Enterococcus murrayae TaxID=2815321 RepID=A0ABS3HNT2_9ENTE|nr:fructose PTS transporter subunit IIA [Enterococcus sp. MJM16]MBO0454218.1 PTS sugar transporter subunit IIA [Enterococcus sp. MJM16]